MLFQMKDEYGVSPMMFTGRLAGTNLMHKRISGGHKEEGFFYISDESAISGGKISVEDMSSIILNALKGRA